MALISSINKAHARARACTHTMYGLKARCPALALQHDSRCNDRRKRHVSVSLLIARLRLFLAVGLPILRHRRRRRSTL